MKLINYFVFYLFFSLVSPVVFAMEDGISFQANCLDEEEEQIAAQERPESSRKRKQSSLESDNSRALTSSKEIEKDTSISYQKKRKIELNAAQQEEEEELPPLETKSFSDICSNEIWIYIIRLSDDVSDILEGRKHDMGTYLKRRLALAALTKTISFGWRDLFPRLKEIARYLTVRQPVYMQRLFSKFADKKTLAVSQKAFVQELFRNGLFLNVSYHEIWIKSFKNNNKDLASLLKKHNALVGVRSIPLLRAIIVNDIEYVDNLTSTCNSANGARFQGCDSSIMFYLIDSKFLRNGSCIEIAARWGSLKLFQILLDHTYEHFLNDGSKFGYYDEEWENRPRRALKKAIEGSSIDIIVYLITSGKIHINSNLEDILLEDKRINTALMLSIKNEKLEVVKALLELPGIDVNIKNEQGDNALLLAIFLGRMAIVQELLQHEATDLKCRNKLGQNIFLIACKWGRLNIVQVLLMHPEIDLNAKDVSGATPLMWACIHGHYGIVKLLLDKNLSDLDAQDQERRTALMYAAGHNHPEIVKLLVDQDSIDVNIKDQENLIAFEYAIKYNHTKVIEIFSTHPKLQICGK